MRKILTGLLAASLSALAIGATTTPVQLLNPSGSIAGQAIVSNGPSSAPTWQAVPLTGVTGVLPIANGGTNASTVAAARTNLGALASASPVFTGTLSGPSASFSTDVTINNSGSSGANINLIGNGAITPSKSIRAANGNLEVVNNAYSAAIFTVTDSGSISASGGINGTSVGAGTPSTGAFTTLSTTGTATLNGLSTGGATISGGSINNTPIGQTTQAAGSFTNLSATGFITPSQTAGIVGTTTNNSANAGSVGEYISSSPAGISLTNATATNITSISLTAGDWEVVGNIYFSTGAGDTMTGGRSGISTTSATQPAIPLYSALGLFSMGPSNEISAIAPVQRLSLSGTTTVYLVATGFHSGGTLTGQGIIRARRVR